MYICIYTSQIALKYFIQSNIINESSNLLKILEFDADIFKNSRRFFLILYLRLCNPNWQKMFKAYIFFAIFMRMIY